MFSPDFLLAALVIASLAACATAFVLDFALDVIGTIRG
jgi:hypothetical protein